MEMEVWIKARLLSEEIWFFQHGSVIVPIRPGPGELWGSNRGREVALERKENVGLNRPGKGGEREAQVNGNRLTGCGGADNFGEIWQYKLI